jgi:ribosomal protein S18 acetylase RimI-like enzyme
MLRASMGGLGNYLFQDLKRTTDEYLEGMYREKGHRFSWSVAFVGEAGAGPAGYLLSYPGRELDALQLAFLRRFWSVFGWGETWQLLSRAWPLLNAPEATRDEYYISNIGVLPEHRGRGYGTQLMEFAEVQSRQAGLTKCSLAVDLTNVDAIRLYQRLGYRVVYTRQFKGKLARQESGYHRMVKHLSS